MKMKKQIALLGIFCLLVISSFAQIDVKDSSVIASKNLPQFTQFMNGVYNYPAKPRDQYEVGVKIGYFNVNGDVASVPSYGFGAHIRKSFGYVFSARANFTYGIAKGLDWKSRFRNSSNPAWIAYPLGYNVFYNYKTQFSDFSVDGILSLNNIQFHKQSSKFNAYLFAGFGITYYSSKIDALNGSGNTYNFASITTGNDYDKRKDTRKALKNLLDGNYETLAEGHNDRSSMTPTAHIGAGFAYKISNKINIAVEDKFTTTNDDLLDGQRWYSSNILTSDFDTYNFLSVGLNINLGAKSVEPLWWINPLDYAYGEIRNPRLMRLPKPTLPDSDGDGVTDQFDLEQTPQGCPVDSHGVSKDTDGDGVPDCKDKELITPTYCQPVDADGVGKCPCIEGCAPVLPPPPTCGQLLGALPNVMFAKNSSKLTEDATRLLAVVADRMRNNPNCKVVIIGYCAGNKHEQQRSWDRVESITGYLVEKEGVSRDRIIFKYGEEGGDCDTVDIRSANDGEEGVNAVPAPHPNLRKN